MMVSRAAKSPSRRAFVVLDRDGTLIVDRGYTSDPDQVELLPGVAEGLAALRQSGLGVVVLTNQSGVGRRLFAPARVYDVHRRLDELLAEYRQSIDGYYVCPHLPNAACPCRKPQPGLLWRAAREHGFDPACSFVVGDKPSDIQLGRAVGAMTFFLPSPDDRYGTCQQARADHVARDLREVAAHIATIR